MLPSAWPGFGLRLCACCFCLLLAITSSSALHAWDATGHRLSVYVAYQHLTPAQREHWHQILQHHPRFANDFEQAMPEDLRAAPRDLQTRWLLGQAAVWPDLARGLPDAIRPRYNQPDWHWIDGAWVRDEAQTQGNLYIDTPALPDIDGVPASNSRHPAHAGNVLTALERAHWQLEHDTDAAQRALALCWLLHLIGDIHQPLHTGGLVTARLFPDGDRGGNAIRIQNGNLHAVWDQALRGPALNDSLATLTRLAANLPAEQPFTPTRWLHESRLILLRQVYPAPVIDNVRRSENAGTRLGSITLSQQYQVDMKHTATIRLAEAGVRIGSTLSAITGSI
tara:strand:- start:1428 stop:2441 length:1014 start_codon:yes stop_codon:yes gene_type:complete